MHQASVAATLPRAQALGLTPTYPSKRRFDIVVASVLLVLVCATLLLPAAMALAWLNTGSVFFLQKRVGEGGKTFVIWKFCTMRDGKADMLGRILRALCLDELPQLFQVLAGTMSIVGPRPLMLSEFADWLDRNPDYLLRQIGKPGLASLVVLLGKAKELSERYSFEPLGCDLDYLRQQSLVEDLRLLGLTVLKILRLWPPRMRRRYLRRFAPAAAGI